MGVNKFSFVIALAILLLIDVLFGQKLLQLVNAPGAYKARGLRISHDVFHHTLTANYSGYDEWGVPYPYCTDKNGFRTSCNVAPSDGKRFEYVFLGDSMLEGLGIPYENTIAGKFSKLTGTTAVNLSVSSYSPSIHAEKLNYYIQEGFRFENVILFVDISDIEDEAKAYVRHDGKVLDQKQPKLSRQFERKLRHTVEAAIPLTWHGINVLKRQIKHFGQPKTQAWGVNTDRDSDRAGWTYLLSERGPEFRAMVERGLERSEVAVKDIAELAKKTEAQLYLVIYPWPHQIAFDTDQKNRLERWAEKVTMDTSSTLINFLKTFREERQAQGASELIKTYYIDGDTHFSSKGHERIATLLVNILAPSANRAITN